MIGKAVPRCDGERLLLQSALRCAVAAFAAVCARLGSCN
jgi:hypothetical protein